MKEHNNLYKIRHSTAHLLAQAVTELYPEAILTLGPVKGHGFFYDFFLEERLKEADLEKIEAQMHEIAKRNEPIIGKQIPKKEALEIYKNNKFKTEIISGLDVETVGIFEQGKFFDLCEGGHVSSTGTLKNFKLTALAGSYWRANRENEQLQRISGIAFESKKDLEQHIEMIEDLKKYDHRLLGKQLDLFSFHDESPGMPFFHSKGLKIFNKLIDHSRALQERDGYLEIQTPLILSEKLWKTSGHYENYKENMYFAKVSGDDHKIAIRPMNCPPCIILYKERPHSYKELPLKMAEFGKCHRFELSGVLHGLFRVRSFTMDDAHIYCTEDQISDEVEKVLKLAEEVYKPFGFTKIRMAISTMPEKRIGSDALWEQATNALKTALTARGQDFIVNEGEGAFYGPKIEILIEDNMGREWQCGTVQIDFFLPKNFELEYIASDQSRKTPVIIHRAIYGSLERFMGILTEHYKGRFPLWLAPVQARVLTITDKQGGYAQNVCNKLRSCGIRAELDGHQDKISAQIKRAQLDYIPWMIVLGAKEEENKTVTLRTLDGKQEFGLTVEELSSRINN
jgi:threonyl-tRNA synthetase